LADQPQDSRVCNPVRQRSQQPVNAVRASADGGIENPVHRLCRNSFAHHPQRLMVTASRSEAKGAVEEVGLIDGTQDLRHRALDDFRSANSLADDEPEHATELSQVFMISVRA
jgi:hypothetical protein